MRRRRSTSDLPEPESDTVDLSSAEHAWWAEREDLDAGVPQGKRRKKPEPGPKQSVFEEYFTRDSLFDQPTTDHPVQPEHDPYRILGLPETCSWDDITAAHRRLAKVHHPDRLLDSAPEDRKRSETRIRELNIAYTELRRRRGR